MTRVEKIGSATLYLGRCEDVLPTLSGIDLFVTSPPYNLGVSTGGGSPNKGAPTHGHYDPAGGYRVRGGSGKWKNAALADGYDTHDDKMPWAEYEAWQRSILTLCWAALSDDGAIYYNHKPRPQHCEIWLPTALNPGLPLRQIITWARAGGINYSPTHYVPTCEWVLVLAKPNFRLRDKAASGVGDVWYIPQEPSDDHPAPFPLELPMRAIQTTSAKLVCDPFAGIGTSGVACGRLGCDFIGIEPSQKYFDIMCKRVERAQKQRDLFIAPPPSATSKQAELLA